MIIRRLGCVQQSLLAYLLLHHSVPQSRSHLAFLLWPDSTDAQAHTNLRNLVHKLRQALPDADAFLRSERQTLAWQPSSPQTSWTLDVQDFEEALAQVGRARNGSEARHALEAAVKLYRGDLLRSCYDEWILPERDRLRQSFLDVLERLIGVLEEARDYPAAISAAQRLLQHDPLREATYRQLMHLYASNGDRAAALRTYHACATAPSLLHGQETMHAQGSRENAGDLRLSAEQSAGWCLLTSFHSIDIVSGRTGRLALRSLLSLGLQALRSCR